MSIDKVNPDPQLTQFTNAELVRLPVMTVPASTMQQPPTTPTPPGISPAQRMDREKTPVEEIQMF